MTGPKRRRLTKAERLEVYRKMDGHCAYCGCDLDFKDMQVDHVIPLNGWNEQGPDTLDNMLPACRSCNHYKSTSTLEDFRKHVENMPNVLMRDSVTYKNAVRFGLIPPTSPRWCMGSGFKAVMLAEKLSGNAPTVVQQSGEHRAIA